MFIELIVEIIILTSAALVIYYILNARLQKRLKSTMETCMVSQSQGPLGEMYEFENMYISKEVYDLVSRFHPEPILCLSTDPENSELGVDFYHLQKRLWDLYQFPLVFHFDYTEKEPGVLHTIVVVSYCNELINEKIKAEMKNHLRPVVY